MRFQLIDRVLSQRPGELVAVKVLTASEAYLADHFPGFAVMPGVLMLESLVQAARELASREGYVYDRPLVMTRSRNVRYTALVRPGDSLRLTVSRRGEPTPDHALEFDGAGLVADRVAVRARFTLGPLPLPAESPPSIGA